MSNLPSGWKWAHLEELAAPVARAMTDGPFGSNLKSAHYVDSGPRVIRLQNIGFGEFIDERAHISEEHFQTLRAHEARAGDLVVASLGQDLPRACLIPPHVGPAIVKADCIRIRLHPDVDARYVNYAVQRPALRHAVADQVHGVGRPRLGMTGIKQFTIPLPPKAEQERIVNALEERLSRLEAAQVALGSALHRLDTMRTRGLDELMGGECRVRPLGDVLLSLRNGCFVSRPKTEPPGLPIFRISAVRPLELDVTDIRYAPSTLERAADFQVEEGDLLFTRYSGNPDYVGACATVPPEGAGVLHPDKLIRGVPNGALAHSQWIALALTASIGRREIEKRLKTTAGQVGIAGSQLKSVPIPVPPIDEQADRLARWNHMIESLYRLRSGVESAARRAGQTRRSILAAACAGQLVPQDPGDEPAPVLLDRIRKERTAAAPTKRTRKVKT